MGIANAYNRVIRRQLEQHAAWLPLANIFRLGDFGVVSNGLFTRIGNVSDLGLHWKEKDGGSTKLEFTSQSVTTTRIEGGAKVDVFSNSAAVDAKLVLGFERKASFVLKAATITSREIDDVFAVAAALHDHSAWRRRYRFVRQVYSAQNPLILANIEGSTTVTISGKAVALKQLDLGDASATLELATDRELALEIVGDSGTIGLGLARIKLSGAVGPAGEGGKPGVGIEEDTDWDADPEDDI
jgi:hypothetical protein